MVKVGERCIGVLGENPLMSMKISNLGILMISLLHQNS